MNQQFGFVELYLIRFVRRLADGALSADKN
jgi:hypothetical protein